MGQDLRRLGEFGLIARFQSHVKFHHKQVIVGIGDDCTVYKASPGKHLIATTDALVEKVHFDLSCISPEQLGRKSLAVNISDIAAMGGSPILALISLAIPKNLSVRWLDGYYKGLSQISGEYGVEIAGGDTVASSKSLFINITLLGEVDKKRCFSRSGAKPGDKILVTGSLGDSALGLKLLTMKKRITGTLRDKKFLIGRHLNPTPRMVESRMLASSDAKVTAMIDLSDGLAQDLGHICDSSSVGARLLETALPTSQSFENITLNNSIPAKNLVLAGGEDYELLFTLRPKSVKNLLEQFQKAGKRLSCIGEITPDAGRLIMVNKKDRREILPKNWGFNHFSPQN